MALFAAFGLPAGASRLFLGEQRRPSTTIWGTAPRKTFTVTMPFVIWSRPIAIVAFV
jgi:hypothetical protein